MKRFILLSFSLLTLCTLKAAIHYTSFGDGWEVPVNANVPIDIDDNGSTDFFINGHTDELGFVPVFVKGCFSSPSEMAKVSFGARELQRHQEGELIQINGNNIYDYIDDDRGSAFSLSGGLADGWVDLEEVYIGFAIIDGAMVRNGWLTTYVDVTAQKLVIKEWAYTDLEVMDSGGILAGEKGEFTAVQNLEGIESLSISPNPAKDRFQLKFDYAGNEDLSVIIQNSVGKEVYRTGSKLPSGSFNLNIATTKWTTGIYFIRFETVKGIRTEKLSIVR